MTEIDLKVLQAGGADQIEREPDDLHVRLERAVAQQLGADLERLAGPAAPLRLLPVDLARIAEPERQPGVPRRRATVPRVPVRTRCREWAEARRPRAPGCRRAAR